MNQISRIDEVTMTDEEMFATEDAIVEARTDQVKVQLLDDETLEEEADYAFDAMNGNEGPVGPEALAYWTLAHEVLTAEMIRRWG